MDLARSALSPSLAASLPSICPAICPAAACASPPPAWLPIAAPASEDAQSPQSHPQSSGTQGAELTTQPLIPKPAVLPACHGAYRAPWTPSPLCA